ncbi:MAG: phosphoglycerate kinase [Acidimicrobiales bacterium]|nr:MAG: phosphoglycerate kinase [marine actinobacterium MedAcidi-G1]HAQ04374.1 phosphoglycerate kinase [Acidimicrobiaceae bacterium]
MDNRKLPTLEELEAKLGGFDFKRILVRSDLNVPITDGLIDDDLRIKESLRTLEWLAERKASVVVCSHLGRPNGQKDSKYSIEPVREKLLDKLPDLHVLENLRFNPGEELNDQAFIDYLVSGAGEEAFDAYVNDAFGASHREHASIVGPPKTLPSAAGFLLQREVEIVQKVLDSPKRPFLMLLGGAKVSDKLALIEKMLDSVDEIIIGGGMCFTFLAASGIPVGDSLVEKEMLETCRRLMDSGISIKLPLDFTAMNSNGQIGNPDIEAEVRQCGGSIPDGWMGLDIGPGSAVEFSDAVFEAGTVLWNGPMGVFEDPRFSAGTETVARGMAETRAFTFVGGGDSAFAIKKFGFSDSIDHISTGGGATLELIEKGDLPGLMALRESEIES